MGLLDGLEKLGLGGLDKVDIYEEPPKEKKEEKPAPKLERVIEETDFQNEEFALIHPGGAVGARLAGRPDV